MSRKPTFRNPPPRTVPPGASAPASARRRGPTRGFITTSTLMLWLCTGIAATAFWPVYQSSEFVVMAVVTTVAASAIAILGAVYRMPAHVIVLASILAYAVLGVPLAVPSQALYGVIPTLEGLRDLAVGTALSWKQLLTITLPVADYQALLVPAFILLLATVTMSLSIALRAPFGEVAAIGPIILFLAALAFGPTTEFFPRAVPLALTAALLFWLVWFRWYRRRASVRVLTARLRPTAGPGGARPRKDADESSLSGFRTLVGAGLIIAIAAGGSISATAVVRPEGEREVLRTAVALPFDPRAYASPLSSFRRYHQPGNAAETMLSVDGLPEGARVRIATLDSYDGIVYSVGGAGVASDSGSFTLVPYQFDQSAIDGTPVTVDVAIGEYSGVWLPTVGKLEGIEFGGPDAEALRGSFYYNDNGGSAAVVREVGPGDSYRLKGILPNAPSDRQLDLLTPGDAALPPVGVLPDELSVALDGYVTDVAGDGARLRAALDGLRRDGYISHGISEDEPRSRSGHSADRITELFTESRMIGDGEQYAVAAAIMARELGFPSRVVVGFVPEPGSDFGSEIVLTGDDIAAWIEVDTTEYGWVTLDPTPAIRDIPEQLPEEPTEVARPQSPVQPPVEDQEIPDDALPPNSPQDEVDAIDPFLVVLLAVLQIGGWVLLAAAILVSPFLAIVVAKLRRRQLRRKAATPLARVRAGWDEFEDAVLDHGYVPPGSPTRSEFAGVIGGIHPLVLAAATDRAVFAPSTPEPAEADQVWHSVDELRTSLGVGLTRWQRARALVSLRSFGTQGRARGSSRSRR